MKDTSEPTAEPGDETPGMETANGSRPLAIAKAIILVYGAMCAVVFASVVAGQAIEGDTTAFEWIRSSVILLSAVVLYRQTVEAARGSRPVSGWARLLAAVLPAAIIAGELVSGTPTRWFWHELTVCAVVLTAAAVVLNLPRMGPVPAVQE